MKKTELAKLEEERLKAVESYDVVGSPPEPAFDEICAMAAQVCETKHAMINIIDRDNLWFKATYNVEGQECPRDISFCSHVILEEKPLIVPDTYKDVRFNKNPQVTMENGIRFYAGAPIINPDGYKIGSLCIFDEKIGQLTQEQESFLVFLAKNIANLLELNLKHRSLSQSIARSKEFESVAKIGGWELDLVSQETMWTDQIYEIYGLEKECETNKNQGLAQYEKESQKKLEKLIQLCIEKGTDLDDTFEFFDSNGQRKWLRNIGRLNESKTKIIGTCQDITEQVEKEKEIKIQRQFLSNTINNLPSPFYARTGDGEILFSNKEYDSHFGRTTNPMSTFEESVLAPFFENDKVVLENGQIVEEEISVTDKHGQPYHFQSFHFPYRDTFGKIFASGCIAIDITNKKALEKQNLHRAKLASIGEMAAGAGHEINNPLAVISGNVYRLLTHLEKGSADPETIKTVLEKINNASFRIAKIVSSINGFARSENNGKKNFCVNDIMQETVSMLNDVYGTQKTQVGFIDQTDSFQAYINADQDQIQQVLVNLVSNAFDAIGDNDAAQVNVKCHIDPEGNDYIFEVHDNGCGIPENQHERIFEPFFTTKEKSKGTGLGLSLVRKMLHDNDATIELVQSSTSGTQFLVRLPLVKEAEVAPTTTGETPQLTLDKKNQNKKILIIDDEEGIRSTLKDNLELFDHEVQLAESGKKGLEILDSKPDFDIILCDVRMPGMDGYQFFLEFKKRNFPVKPKFIYLTGGVNMDLALPMDQISDEIDGLLYKPFSIESLLDTINNSKQSKEQKKPSVHKKNKAS